MGHKYNVTTYWEHMVSVYANISLFDVEKLDIFEYWRIVRDAFIYTFNKTEKGQEYLDNAYRITQTEPERKRLREAFGKEG